MKKTMRRGYGPPQTVVRDKLRSYGAAMRDIGNQNRQNTKQYAKSSREFISTVPATRAGYDPLQADLNAPEVHLHPRLGL